MAKTAKDCRNDMSLRLCKTWACMTDYSRADLRRGARDETPPHGVKPTSTSVARAQDSSKEPAILPVPALRVKRLCLYTRAPGSPKR